MLCSYSLSGHLVISVDNIRCHRHGPQRATLFSHKFGRDYGSNTLNTYTDSSSTAVVGVKLCVGHPVQHAMLLSRFVITFSGLLGAVVLDMAGPPLPSCLRQRDFVW